MRVGIVITMYNEQTTVLRSIEAIKASDFSSYIVVVHSDDGNQSIKDLADEYILLPNLALTVNKYQVPAASLCRNFSQGFQALYSTGKEYDVVVALTGDTLITDANNFVRRIEEMQEKGKLAAASQAISQLFWSDSDDPNVSNTPTRYQNEDTTDIMPQLFLLDGKVFRTNKWFCNIEMTNKWTSEQCLGDELVRVLPGEFHDNVLILNEKNICFAYNYNDGVTLQYGG